MRNSANHLLFLVFWVLVSTVKVWAQASPNCSTLSVEDYYTGRTFFNYGSASNNVNNKVKLSATVGQTVTGNFFGSGVKGGFGFWAGFTMPPKPPVVIASQGDLEDMDNFPFC